MGKCRQEEMRIPKKAIITFDYGNEVRDYFFNLQELYDIIKEKQLIIDKAIEYIENNINELKEDHLFIEFKKEELYTLLDILKGSDKE